MIYILLYILGVIIFWLAIHFSYKYQFRFSKPTIFDFVIMLFPYINLLFGIIVLLAAFISTLDENKVNSLIAKFFRIK